MKIYTPIYLIVFLFSFSSFQASAQTVKGKVSDVNNNDPLIGATIVVEGFSGSGTITDFDGDFEIKVDAFPSNLIITYVGYKEKTIEVTSADQKIKVSLEEDVIVTQTVEVVGQKVSEKQKAAPLTVESLDILAIKETPADNFYDGLGALKGVDLTAASLGFKVINTRGFNSTSPVRSLQIIDGVDNQSPGLNFSLGNFLGSSELDVLKVDIIQGAASAYYGPNAFNGVIAMETKNPFIQKGLSVLLKGGERNLFNSEIRWADAIKNKDGNDFFAYKLNFSFLRADDWEATNEQAVDGTDTPFGNPGGWDKVNTYGDEYFSLSDFSDEEFNLPKNQAGLGTFHRTGYDEIDLVDYNTRNLKANIALHFRTNPDAVFESPEFIISSSMGNGTTVYQGDNRFSLRNILFFQNRLEFRKKGKYFIRAYATNEDAGDSYDPYFTALRLQERSKEPELWSQDYTRFWQENIYPQMLESEYPTPSVNPMTGQLIFDYDQARTWINNHQTELTQWHSEAAASANTQNPLVPESNAFYVPGTPEFTSAFDEIRSAKNTEGGTRFFDKSALYHVHGEYNFVTNFLDEIKVGANYRLYAPKTEGTVFKDETETITNSEFGIYTGFQKKFTRKLILSGTFRMDKNENFNYIFTPAASLVYSPNPLNYLRFSFSSGVRNPTLSDQYLNLNVGPATLVGNLDGYYNLFSLDSFIDYITTSYTAPLVTLSIDPIKPENVKTFEAGYRTTLFEKLYLDGSYYFNIYNNFIGYNLGVETTIDTVTTGIPSNTSIFRVAANSTEQVTTQGFSVGLSYYFGKYYKFSGNYSFNKLLKSDEDDPIIPAFNTPENKYNIGVSGRGIPLNIGSFIKDFGFSFNYKWVEGFLFEGSPQFTGFIENYGLVDGQLSFGLPKANSTLKIGASNLLNNKVNQTYGGPAIGRLAYISIIYDFKKQ